MERLYAFKFRKSNFLLNILKRILEFSVRSHLVSSLAAFFMTLIVQSAAGIQRDLKLALVSLLYIFSMYSINNYFDRAFLKESNSYKYAIYGRFGSLYFGLSLACIALSGWLTYGYGLAASTILGLSYFLGLVYSTGPVRALVQKAGLIMKRAYNTKIIATIGWLVPLLLLPYIIYSPPILPMISVGTAIFTIILFRQTLMDVIAIQGDVIFGEDTIPVLFGIERTFIMLSALASAASLPCASPRRGPPLADSFSRAQYRLLHRPVQAHQQAALPDRAQIRSHRGFQLFSADHFYCLLFSG